MAQRFISTVALVLLASAGFAQAFGRFGYNQFVEVPGFKIDREGFAASSISADKIWFPQPSTLWKPVATAETEQTVVISEPAGGPSKALFNLLGVGFSLYFPSDMTLSVRSQSAPFLSWEQGSVAEGVSTPEVSWLVLSFRTSQPPIVIGFPKGKVSLSVTGHAGAWMIQSAGKIANWVRFALPEGLQGQAPTTAATLGKLAKEAATEAALWAAMPPRLLKTNLSDDLHSVTATWQFDTAGAVVPMAATMANLGRYMLTVNSPTRKLRGWTEYGPTEVVEGTSLSIRFPVRRVPTGRCLSVGSQLENPLGGVSPLDIPSVVDLALEALVAERDSLTRKAAEDTISEFVTQATYSPEPWTKQQLPFDAAGKGLDLAAAHALLMQAITSTERATSESNSLLTSVSWRQDWLTWRVWTKDVATAQRAGALAALAGALCPEPERRLAAAMFQAGLSGEAGLGVWKRHHGLLDAAPKLIEPLYGLRKGLFGLQGPPEEGEQFAKCLLSPLRVFSDGSVMLIKQGPDYVLQWPVIEVRQSVIALASAYPIDVEKRSNLSYLKIDAALGFTEIHYIPETEGLCEIKLLLPAYGAVPPPAEPVPTYSEPLR